MQGQFLSGKSKSSLAGLPYSKVGASENGPGRANTARKINRSYSEPSLL